MENEKRNTGGLWLKTSKAGNKFMSGSIEIQGKKHQFVVFKNKHKEEGSNHPDYVIFPSNPVPSEQRQIANPVVKAVTQAFVDDINNEEIPF